MADEIVWELRVNPDGTMASFKKVEGQAKKTGKNVGAAIEKPVKKSASNVFDAFKNNFGKIVAMAATLKIGKDIGKGLIDAAIKQDEAVQKLNQSLKTMGSFTEETSRDLQSFASKLQGVSIVGDEVILDQLAFAQAMGASVDQSKEVLKAAVDMSSALGIDLNSSVRNIAKTLGGYAGELGEVIPELKDLTAEQLKNGVGIQLLADKYQGFGIAATKTFKGAMTQMNNAFGDIKEKIGFIIVKNPVVIKGFNILAQQFAIFEKFLKTDSGKNYISDLVIGLADIGVAFANNFTAIKYFFDIINLGFLFAKKTGQSFLVLLSGIAGKIAEWGNKLGLVSDENAAMLADFASSSQDVMGKFRKEFDGAWDGLSTEDSPMATSLQILAAKVRDSLAESRVEVVKTKDTITVAGGEIGEALKVGGDEVETFEKRIAESMKQVSNSIKGALVKTASMGVQALTTSLLLGQNGFSNFGKAVAGMMGDLAIQMGELFIGTAMGSLALSGMGWGAALAAGIGLVALGTVMKSFAGGAGGGVSVPSTGGSTIADSSSSLVNDEESLGLNESETREKQQSVQLVVHGDVLDSDETGTRLLNILNENFESSGGRLITA